MRILLAEDDAMIAMFMADLLSAMGHLVCETVDSELEAIAAAKRHRPDLLIIDVNLNEGSGITAVAEILRIAPLPHIFVTGDPYGLVAVKPGAIVVQKPFMLHDLTRAIEQAVRPNAAKHCA